MVCTYKGTLRPRGTPPALSTVPESPSTSDELPQFSILEEGELVNGVVKTARPQQITLALESQRVGVEPITMLRMMNPKQGTPVEKGMRVSGLVIAFAQPANGVLPRATR